MSGDDEFKWTSSSSGAAAKGECLVDTVRICGVAAQQVLLQEHVPKEEPAHTVDVYQCSSSG